LSPVTKPQDEPTDTRKIVIRGWRSLRVAGTARVERLRTEMNEPAAGPSQALFECFEGGRPSALSSGRE